MNSKILSFKIRTINPGIKKIAGEQTLAAGGVAEGLLCFLGFSLASAFAQFLLGFGWRGRGRGSSRGSVVVIMSLFDSERRSEEQVGNPGLDESEGRSVRVASCHDHLEKKHRSMLIY